MLVILSLLIAISILEWLANRTLLVALFTGGLILYWGWHAVLAYRRGGEQISIPPAAFQWRATAASLPVTPSPMTPRALATRAIFAANNDTAQYAARLEDIGLLVYTDDGQPAISRDETIPAFARYLRPFISLYWPLDQGALGRIKFELLDDRQVVRFVSEGHYVVKPGVNFITPTRQLPMGDHERGGEWALRVSVGGELLALHRFSVVPDMGADFRAHLREDGEIAEWLARAALEVPVEPLSLDALLADQQPDIPKRDTQRREHSGDPPRA